MTVSIPGIPEAAAPLFAQLAEEPLVPHADLKAQVVAYVKTFDPTHSRNQVVNPIQVMQVSATCTALLDRISEDAPEEERRLTQAACRYFVTEEDATNDRGESGLDDDIAVVNAVARHLGLDDLVIQGPPPPT